MEHSPAIPTLACSNSWPVSIITQLFYTPKIWGGVLWSKNIWNSHCLHQVLTFWSSKWLCRTIYKCYSMYKGSNFLWNRKYAPVGQAACFPEACAKKPDPLHSVLVCSSSYNKDHTLGGSFTTECTAHSSEGQEVQARGAHRFGVWWRLTLWLIAGHILAISSHVEGVKEISGVPYIETLDPFMTAVLSWPDHFPNTPPTS